MNIRFLYMLLFTCTCFCQESEKLVVDSLQKKNFGELIYKIYTYRSKKDTLSLKLYSEAYLKRAIYRGDSMRISEGYHFKAASTFDDNLTIKYLDTSLIYSKNHEGEIVPASTYLTKSVIYSRKSNYKEALNNLLLAYSSAKRNNSENYTSVATYNIGVIKSRIGLHQEALKYAKEAWNYRKKGRVNSQYLWCLSLLSSESTNTGDLETGTRLNKLGVKNSIETNNLILRDIFVFLEGVNLYHKKEYYASIDNLNKSLPTHIKNNHNVQEAAIYLYLGKSYYNIKEHDNAMLNFKKVDSVFLKQGGLLPKCREAYKFLIDDAKQNNDLKLQLYYTNQLLKFDNLLQKNYEYISSTIYKKHETPLLLEEKDNVINKLKNNNNRYSYYIILSIFISLLIFSFLIINYKRKRKYKEKFEELMKLNKENKIQVVKNKKIKSITLDEDTISKVLNKLYEFETQKTFLEKKMSLNSLSKEIGVNSKYISKVINIYKEKTVSQYINTLRLNYCVERLKNDRKFRKYTLDYIAGESGFSTRRAFNTAFLKQTGISPSYFINSLNN